MVSKIKLPQKCERGCSCVSLPLALTCSLGSLLFQHFLFSVSASDTRPSASHRLYLHFRLTVLKTLYVSSLYILEEENNSFKDKPIE